MRDVDGRFDDDPRGQRATRLLVAVGLPPDRRGSAHARPAQRLSARVHFLDSDLPEPTVLDGVMSAIREEPEALVSAGRRASAEAHDVCTEEVDRANLDPIERPASSHTDGGASASIRRLAVEIATA